MTDPNLDARIGEAIRARGARYARLVEHRHERERVRKRKARKLQTPLQRERERVRKQEARKRQTPQQRQREKEREGRRCRRKLRPFMAVDGEGGGTDKLGRQNYLLMVASAADGAERVLNRRGRHLLTYECLEFLLSRPRESILVGYGFGYDATQMLRGIKQETLRQILNPRQGKHGPCYTYWDDYAIIYQQGQYFRVARVDRSGPKPAVIKGSSRTVYETLGFFQCTFVKAIGNWGIGSEHERLIIAENKDCRDEFTELTKEIIDYCKLECRYLAMLMEALRTVCAEVEVLPKQWSGAGWLAAALLTKHGLPKRPLTAREIAAQAEKKPTGNSKPTGPRRPERDLEFEVAANHAYYGVGLRCLGSDR
jgi:hypothetical protein